MRIDLSAGIRRVDGREFVGKLIVLAVFVVLGAGCGAIVRVAVQLIAP